MLNSFLAIIIQRTFSLLRDKAATDYSSIEISLWVVLPSGIDDNVVKNWFYCQFINLEHLVEYCFNFFLELLSFLLFRGLFFMFLIRRL